jgi:hypothetical protein
MTTWHSSNGEPSQPTTNGTTTDEPAECLDHASHDPAFRATCHDARARSPLPGAAQGITQAEPARRMQTPESPVTGPETGGTDPHLPTLQRYARALGIPLDLTLTIRHHAAATCLNPQQRRVSDVAGACKPRCVS